MNKFFDSFVSILTMVLIIVLIWFFLAYILIFCVVVLGIVFIAFVCGITPVSVTYKDGAKSKYYIDVVKLWRNR